MLNSTLLVEICAFSLDDARAAAAAGAHRIELCVEPDKDGTTPPDDMLDAASTLLATCPIHPIVRPRDSMEVKGSDLQQMLESLAVTRDLGYPGAVVGALRDDQPDWDVLAQCREVFPDGNLTFHRAFDLVVDQHRALRGLAELGFRRVLTSGRPGRAVDHLPTLASLASDGEQVGITVMAGGGVASTNATTIFSHGIREIHASAGGSAGHFDLHEVTALLDIADKLNGNADAVDS